MEFQSLIGIQRNSDNCGAIYGYCAGRCVSIPDRDSEEFRHWGVRFPDNHAVSIPDRDSEEFRLQDLILENFLELAEVSIPDRDSEEFRRY